MAKQNKSLAVTLSAIYATLLFLGSLAVVSHFVWSQLGAVGKLWIIAVPTCAFFAACFGWLYREIGCRPLGHAHALMMLAIGMTGTFRGVITLSDKSFMGGQGPDANPAAGIFYLVAFVVSAFGLVAIVCAIMVTLNMLKPRDP